MSLAHTVEEFLKSRHVDYELVSHPHSVSSLRTAERAHLHERGLTVSMAGL